MKRKPEIEISEEDVEILLDNEYRHFKDITRSQVHCAKCSEGYTVGIVNYRIFLNKLNDIVLRGSCSNCGHPVNRYLEFGEDKEFSERADLLRTAIDDIKKLNSPH